MACFHPVTAYELNVPYGQPRRFSFRADFSSEHEVRFPCGKCIGCRTDRARDWAYRCVMESCSTPPAFFLTLTYSDDEVPISFAEVPYFPSDDEDYDPPPPVVHYSLRADDMRLFFMQVTKRLGPVRKLYCGEYGSRTMRPHYHAITFGLDIPDLKYYSVSEYGDILYTSEALSRCWYNASTKRIRGSLLIGQATPASMAYTAGYTLKKLGSRRYDYEKLGIEPEFIRMSRRPGIGLDFFSEHEDLVQGGVLYIPTPNGSVSVRCPRAFRRILTDSDPVSSLWYSMERQRSILFSDQVTSSLTDLDPYAILAIKEMSFEAKHAASKSVL